jgi:hypothetical protein
MSEPSDPLLELLVRKARSESRALHALEDVGEQFGLRPGGPYNRVVAAAALVRMGVPSESVCSLLSWGEFEGFCAGLLSAAGYKVASNIVITKPRRQLDVFAESPALDISVDCKHWSKGFSQGTLEKIAQSQVERTTLYKKKRGISTPILPAVFTILDAQARVVSGVPVVPVFALRDFLASVSRFDTDFVMV